MKVCPTCNRTFTEDHLSYCTSCGTPLVNSKPSSSSGQSGQQTPNEDLMKTMLSPSPGPQSFSSLNEPTPPTPFSGEPSSFNDPEESMKTMVAPPSLFSDFGSSTPSSSSSPQQRPVYDEPKNSSGSRPFAEPPPKQSDAPFDAPYKPLFSGEQPLAPKSSFDQSSQPQWGPPPPPGSAWGTGGEAVAMGAGVGYRAAPQQTLATVSLILGLVSITIGLCCYLGFLTGPAAIITGIIALVQIKSNSMFYTGKGLAIGGIILGALYFVIFILMFVLGIALNIVGALAS